MDYFITKGHILVKEFETYDRMIGFFMKMPRHARAEARLNDLSEQVPRYADGLDFLYDGPAAWKSVPEAVEDLKRRTP